MNIVVLVKQVPDTYSERKLRDDGVLDRDATDAVLDEINERAVEAALQLKEANDGSEVTVLTMGPDRATDAIRKALSMGADKAVHLSDEAALVSFLWVPPGAPRSLRGRPSQVKGACGVAARWRKRHPGPASLYDPSGQHCGQARGLPSTSRGTPRGTNDLGKHT